jgi:hypothetical protein
MSKVRLNSIEVVCPRHITIETVVASNTTVHQNNQKNYNIKASYVNPMALKSRNCRRRHRPISNIKASKAWIAPLAQ